MRFSTHELITKRKVGNLNEWDRKQVKKLKALSESLDVSPVTIEHCIRHSGDQDCTWPFYLGKTASKIKEAILHTYGEAYERIMKDEIKIAHVLLKLYEKGEMQPSGEPSIKISISSKKRYPYCAEINHDPMGISTALPVGKYVRIAKDGTVVIKQYGVLAGEIVDEIVNVKGEVVKFKRVGNSVEPAPIEGKDLQIQKYIV